MTAKKLEDLNVAKTNRVVVNEMEGKKKMFSARYFLLSFYQNVQCSLFVILIVSCRTYSVIATYVLFGEDRLDTRNQSQSLYPHVLGADQFPVVDCF